MKKAATLKSNELGFTLVEVLAALLIFSFAIVTLTHSGAESVRAVSVLEQKTYAGIVADNRIVRARSVSYTHLTLPTNREV